MEKQKSQLKIGVVLNYMNMIVSNLIPIFYTPVMLELLGKREYGLFKLANSVTSYLSLISLGLGSAISRYLIKAMTQEGQEAEQKILGLFVIIFRCIAGAAFVIGVSLTLNLGLWYSASLTVQELTRMKIIAFILVCNTALNFLISPYMSVISAHERFVFQQCMNILTTCVGPLLNIVMLLLGYASIGMAIASLAMSLVVRMCYLYYIRKDLHIRPTYQNLPKHLVKEIFLFSFWAFVANLAGQLYNATDTVMIGAVPELGTDAVAVYNVGTVFMSIMFSMTTGISSLLSPKTSKMVFAGASSTELTDLAIRFGRLQGYIAALVAMGFIAFGRPFIDRYAGPGFEQAYPVAISVMIPSLIPLVQSVCLSVIVAQNRHRFRSLVYLGIAIANVIGTWFLMHTSLGIVGAALMTGVATFCGQGIVMNWYYWKRTGLEIGRFWKELGKLYIIPGILCVITLVLSNWIDFHPIEVMAVGIVTFTGIYCLLSWRFVMNDFEKELFLGALKTLRKRLKKA